MNQEEYFSCLRQQVSAAFETNDNKNNHLDRFRWLIGALGDPFSGIWFVGENPSLSMVERAVNPDGGPATEEAQWSASRGDRLFRDMLVKHGFKSGEWNTLGGWRCYITDVIKEADYAEQWRKTSKKAQYEAADKWAGVLRYELEITRPVLVVALGKTVHQLLKYLTKHQKLPFPQIEVIDHYSYVALRPRGHQGPMHPERVQEYDDAFAQIARQFRELNGNPH